MPKAKMRALSIRQPYAEQIMRGEKKIEFRTVKTNIRERVYVYASKTPAAKEEFTVMKLQPGDLPSGVIVGSVEIADCTDGVDWYEWHLKNPVRLARLRKPQKQPQPIWFYPF